MFTIGTARYARASCRRAPPGAPFAAMLVLLMLSLAPRGADATAKRGLRVVLRESEAPGAAEAGEVQLYSQSYALVIGIDEYRSWPRLSQAVADARQVAAALKARGFEVSLVENADASRLERALHDFFVRKGQQPDARLFVWYAGHGHSIQGEGYLVPSDAPLPGDYVGFIEHALPIRRFGELTRLARSKHALAVFDACFAGTIFAAARSSPPPAVTSATTQPVREFISSGDAGQEVSDDGLFRKLFVDALSGRRRADANGDGYLTGSELGLFLTDSVVNYSNQKQTPRYGKLRDPRFDRGDFVFALPGRQGAERLAALPPAPPSVKGPQAGSGLTLEDLQAQAKKERAVRAAWERKLEQMEEDYAKVEGFNKRGASRALEQRAWQRFLAAYPENDPYTDRDEALRKAVRQRLSELAPKYALLTVHSNVADDLVVIDGQRLGPTGAAPHQLAPGRHTVRVEKRGYRAYEKTLTLAAGESETLSAVLAVLQRAAADMLEVPGGEFFAGCNAKVDSECDDDEKPGRIRSIDTFWIDRTEVTVASYAECVDAGTCSAEGLKMPFWEGKEHPDWAWACNWGKSGRRTHPINCVDWAQAKAYCQWRGKRLPTEWEWEKAARGTDGRKYPWGNRGYGSAGQVANIADRTGKRKHSDWNWALDDYDDGYETTAPVGSFPAGASPYGALDMMGNVWEWTRSKYGTSHDYRVVRGGSWVNSPRYDRASYRLRNEPRYRLDNIGFRCAQ